MIVYGVAADVSIARLFVAGVLPGIMLMLLFSGYIIVWALLDPRRTPAARLCHRPSARSSTPRATCCPRWR